MVLFSSGNAAVFTAVRGYCNITFPILQPFVTFEAKEPVSGEEAEKMPSAAEAAKSVIPVPLKGPQSRGLM